MSANLTSRATTDAILAAGRSTRARTGVADPVTREPTPDPFRRPTPTDQGWDVAGSSSCDLAVKLHADPRGRGFFLIIPQSSMPLTDPTLSIGWQANGGGASHEQSITGAITGTWTTAAALCEEIATRINTAAPAIPVVVASSSSFAGGALVYVRGLRSLANEAVAAEPVEYGIAYFDGSTSGGSLAGPMIVLREVPEGAFIRVWTRPTARLGDLAIPAPYDVLLSAWSQAGDYGEVGPGGLDERLNVGSRAAVWCELYGVDWTVDYDIESEGFTLIDLAGVLVAPATTEAP
jgi:hypothetical protein